jgi:hypothetical protein
MVELAGGSNNTKKGCSLLHWFCSRPQPCRIMQKGIPAIAKQTWFHHSRDEFFCVHTFGGRRYCMLSWHVQAESSSGRTAAICHPHEHTEQQTEW